MEEREVKTDRGDEWVKRDDRNKQRAQLPEQHAIIARIQLEIDRLRRLRERLRNATKEFYAAAKKKGLSLPEPQRQQAKKAPARRPPPTQGWDR